MLDVDSDKSCSSNSDIHSESDIEQELEEDNEEIAQITDVTEFNESEKLSIIMFLANLKESEILHKEIKGPHNCLVILNIQKRNTGSILRRPGPGKK